ncbi:MAG TPA: ATP-binding protein [Anaerolineales bacterium]|nr:ATP-binding protein [Anaerolineales bacterium]
MAYRLQPPQLRKTCDPNLFSFETTSDLEPELRIIGQPRGTRAIEFGINIASPGYNIYVLGESGTGRTTAIQRFIQEKAGVSPIPDDSLYVFNFKEPHKPRAVTVPAGMGRKLLRDMDAVLESMRKKIPDVFESKRYRDASLAIQHRLKASRDELFEQTQATAAERSAAIVTTPQGLQIVPMLDGKPMPPQAFGQLSEEDVQGWTQTEQDLEHLLNETMYKIQVLERDAELEIGKLVQEVGKSVVDVLMEELISEYQEYTQVVEVLNAAHMDILQHIEILRQRTDEDPAAAAAMEFFLRRYRVNVVIDNAESNSAPVIVELNPTVAGLLGRLDHESRPGGMVSTDFSLIRNGAIHAANGGFLILRAKDLFTEPGAWDALKRVLIGGEIKPDDPALRLGSAAFSLDPEPIPVNLKVVIIGPAEVYYRLFAADEDFSSIFKVMADFDNSMERNPENEQAYAEFISIICGEEGLAPFDRDAVAAMVEAGSRLADSQIRLTTRFGEIADLIREANFWASRSGRSITNRADVRRAEDEKIYRSDRIATRFREEIRRGKHAVSTSGSAVGQVNGLYVSRIGAYMFGQPSRITATVFAGEDGVIQLDREVALAGPIHNKGVYILTGYLGGTYAQAAPLSLNAQITFEQTYSGIEGDSASSTELYALLSALSGVPVKQGIAVTGSVDQFGVVQAVGGVTEKIEGWFEVCSENGLNGEQGVIIPKDNLDDLMLREPVLEAVEANLFHIWAVDNIDEGLDVLTGVPPAEIRTKITRRLEDFARIGRDFRTREN